MHYSYHLQLNNSFFIGKLSNETHQMAVPMMEAIAEYSRKNKRTCISLVRVVVFQADMISKYLEEMKKAGKSGSSIFDMVTAPFRSIKKLFQGKVSLSKVP